MLDASLEVRSAIVYASLIVVLVVVPVFFLRASRARSSGRWPSYVLAILASLVVALTVTPALALLLLGGAPLDEKPPPLVRRLQRGYTAALARVVRSPSSSSARPRRWWRAWR